MSFALFATTSGGSALWRESQSVAIANGAFNVTLGNGTLLSGIPLGSLPFDAPYYLEVTPAAETLSPRVALMTTPYAFRAMSLEPGGTVAGFQISVTGNITLAPSTASVGNIFKGANRFIHNFGSFNTFIGENAGNFTMTSGGNTATAIGYSALYNSGKTVTAGAFVSGVNYAIQSSGNTDFTLVGAANSTAGTVFVANGPGLGTGTAAPTTANNNVALGSQAGNSITSGGNNIAIGAGAGAVFTTGSNNIAIGTYGNGSDANTIRIGDLTTALRTFIAGISGADTGGGLGVIVNGQGQLGTTLSSRRFKDNIIDMDAASSALMKLRPVTFHYKTDHNRAGRVLHYGLIAERVADVYPGLAAHAADGQIETLMYQYLPPMLLNEIQKQQRTIEAQATDLQRQAAQLAQQRVKMEMLEREMLNIKSLLSVR